MGIVWLGIYHANGKNLISTFRHAGEAHASCDQVRSGQYVLALFTPIRTDYQILETPFSRISATSSPLLRGKFHLKFSSDLAQEILQVFPIYYDQVYKKVFPPPPPGSKLGSCCVWNSCLSVLNGQTLGSPRGIQGSVIYRCHYLSMCMYQLSRDLKNSIKKIHPAGKA